MTERRSFKTPKAMSGTDQPISGNLLRNGGFESIPNAGTTGTPTAWTLVGGATFTHQTTDNSEGQGYDVAE